MKEVCEEKEKKLREIKETHDRNMKKHEDNLRRIKDEEASLLREKETLEKRSAPIMAQMLEGNVFDEGKGLFASYEKQILDICAKKKNFMLESLEIENEMSEINWEFWRREQKIENEFEKMIKERELKIKETEEMISIPSRLQFN